MPNMWWLLPGLVTLAGLTFAVLRAKNSWYGKIASLPGKWLYAKFFHRYDIELDNQLGAKNKTLNDRQFRTGFWNENFKLTRQQVEAFAKPCSLTPP
jgi:hypothetical protein